MAMPLSLRVQPLAVPRRVIKKARPLALLRITDQAMMHGTYVSQGVVGGLGTLRGTATLDDLETSFQGGKNIYIQGCAGSGKTTLLKTKVVEMLKQQYGQDCLDSGAVQGSCIGKSIV
eukprot:XP_001702116.1 predicted protein [Chlamydomonas reinhardtii]